MTIFIEGREGELRELVQPETGTYKARDGNKQTLADYPDTLAAVKATSKHGCYNIHARVDRPDYLRILRTNKGIELDAPEYKGIYVKINGTLRDVNYDESQFIQSLEVK